MNVLGWIAFAAMLGWNLYVWTRLEAWRRIGLGLAKKEGAQLAAILVARGVAETEYRRECNPYWEGYVDALDWASGVLEKPGEP